MNGTGIGGTYAVAGPPQVVHYLVLEPWVLVGGTFGIAMPGLSKPVDTQWYFTPKLWRFYAYDFYT